MTGKRVSSNEKRLLKVVSIAWAVWTGCCLLVLLAVLREFDAEKETHLYRRFPESKGEAALVVVLGWGLLGASVTYGGYFAFWRVRYRVGYEDSVVEVAHSWARKQLFVDGELQDERADFDFAAVDLHGTIKCGDASGKEVRVSFASFGSATPICVVIDNRVVFRG